MSNEHKLLPCPFCGCKAKTEISVDGWKSIKCVGCRAETSRFSTIEAVIKSWNQRTPTDTSQQQVGEAADAYCENCGYISDNRVTYSETCDTCHTPVVWHTASEQDLISEQAKRIQELEATAHQWACNSASQNHKIAELKQQLAQHEWVSVEDKRKPAEKVHVFIYGIDGTVAIGKYWADIQKWLVADPRVATGLEVTHWKPITPPNNSGE